MPPIPPWTKRDNFSTPSHQRLADGINALSFLTGTGELDTIAAPGGKTVANRRPFVVPEIVFGKVTGTGPNGEADFSGDGRYWVKKQRPQVPGTLTAITTLIDDDSPEGDMVANGSGDPIMDQIVMATNVTPGDTHAIAANTPVLLIAFYATDDTGKRVKRYMLIPTVSLPVGELDGMVYQNTSQDTGGFADVRLVNR
jgi:hypothetical protein